MSPMKARFVPSEVVAPGTYELVLDSFKELEIKNGPNKGKPMCGLIFRVVDGDYEGKKLTRNYMLEGDGAYYLFDALQKLGADPEELSPADEDGNPMIDPDTGEQVEVDLEPIIKACYGSHVYAIVGNREYQGRQVAEISEIKALDSEDEDE